MDIHTELIRLCYSGYNEELSRVLTEFCADKDVQGKPQIPLDLNLESENDGTTAIIRTVQGSRGCVPAVVPKYRACLRLLVEYGANTNHRDHEGRTAMHWAAQGGMRPVLSELLLLGARPSPEDSRQYTPLLLAVHHGALDCMSALAKLTKSVPSVIDQANSAGTRPLVYAIYRDNPDTLQHLLDLGAQINLRDPLEPCHTPLEHAVYIDKLDTFITLLRYGARLDVPDSDGICLAHKLACQKDSAYLKAFCSLEGSVTSTADSDIMAQQIDVPTEPNASSPGATPLMLACQNERTENVQTLLKKKVVVDKTDDNGKNALHYCVENEQTKTADQLLAADKSLVNQQDQDGYSPLHLAVIAGNTTMVNFLLDRGSDVNLIDNEGHTVVHWATVCSHSELITLLHRRGADLSISDKHQACPVHYAAQMSGTASTNMGSSVSISRADAAAKALETLDTLLGYNVPLDVEDQDQRQPLLWAASSGSSKACDLLINSGANPNSTDKDGLSAIHCSSSRGHAHCTVNILKNHGANVNAKDKNGCTPIFYAITLGHNNCSEVLLLNKADVSNQDNKGRSAAHCAAAKGNIEVLAMIAKHNGPLWLKTERGECPAHEAALARETETVDFLFSKSKDLKRDIDSGNMDNRTCLHLAALTNNLPLCKLLVEKYGADKTLKMRSGQKEFTAYQAAVLKKCDSVAKYLYTKEDPPEKEESPTPEPEKEEEKESVEDENPTEEEAVENEDDVDENEEVEEEQEEEEEEEDEKEEEEDEEKNKEEEEKQELETEEGPEVSSGQDGEDEAAEKDEKISIANKDPKAKVEELNKEETEDGTGTNSEAEKEESVDERESTKVKGTENPEELKKVAGPKNAEDILKETQTKADTTDADASDNDKQVDVEQNDLSPNEDVDEKEENDSDRPKLIRKALTDQENLPAVAAEEDDDDGPGNVTMDEKHLAKQKPTENNKNSEKELVDEDKEMADFYSDHEVEDKPKSQGSQNADIENFGATAQPVLNEDHDMHDAHDEDTQSEDELRVLPVGNKSRLASNKKATEDRPMTQEDYIRRQSARINSGNVVAREKSKIQPKVKKKKKDQPGEAEMNVDRALASQPEPIARKMQRNKQDKRPVKSQNRSSGIKNTSHDYSNPNGVVKVDSWGNTTKRKQRNFSDEKYVRPDAKSRINANYAPTTGKDSMINDHVSRGVPVNSRKDLESVPKHQSTNLQPKPSPVNTTRADKSKPTQHSRQVNGHHGSHALTSKEQTEKSIDESTKSDQHHKGSNTPYSMSVKGGQKPVHPPLTKSHKIQANSAAMQNENKRTNTSDNQNENEKKIKIKKSVFAQPQSFEGPVVPEAAAKVDTWNTNLKRNRETIDYVAKNSSRTQSHAHLDTDDEAHSSHKTAPSVHSGSSSHSKSTDVGRPTVASKAKRKQSAVSTPSESSSAGTPRYNYDDPNATAHDTFVVPPGESRWRPYTTPVVNMDSQNSTLEKQPTSNKPGDDRKAPTLQKSKTTMENFTFVKPTEISGEVVTRRWKRPMSRPKTGGKRYKNTIKEACRIFDTKNTAHNEMCKSRRTTLYKLYRGGMHEKKITHNLKQGYNLKAREKTQEDFTYIDDWEQYLQGVLAQANVDEKVLQDEIKGLRVKPAIPPPSSAPASTQHARTATQPMNPPNSAPQKSRPITSNGHGGSNGNASKANMMRYGDHRGKDFRTYRHATMLSNAYRTSGNGLLTRADIQEMKRAHTFAGTSGKKTVASRGGVTRDPDSNGSGKGSTASLPNIHNNGQKTTHPKGKTIYNSWMPPSSAPARGQSSPYNTLLCKEKTIMAYIPDLTPHHPSSGQTK